ncbi:DUF7426 family protein [Arthrobacter sp. YN]|uniref:DUF7426 family protein n=1 Tax=Arthrobacter sp. YN TaxID=2020486 RepID=UPI000B60C53B|nr:hypothetical protein [Arthrobacter sp. YN]ASN20703.1 hypothetical protein CGK93_14200 [Arthrobacter sp. YN]
MALRPYEDVIGPLVIPYRGKEYTLPQVTLEDGLKMHASADNTTPLSMGELMRIIMGDTAQQMLDDKVPPAVVDRALWAGVADFQQGREAAELVWENGVPKALMEEILQAIQQARTTPTAAATTTKPPASGTGTRNQKKKARRSRGR